MRANCISAWLCATAGAVDDVWVDDEAEDEAEDDVASLVAELLHAPRAATAASAATPVTTVLVLFTTVPFVDQPVDLHLPALRRCVGLS